MTERQLTIVAKFFTMRRYKSDSDLPILQVLDVKYKIEYDENKKISHDTASLRANKKVITEVLSNPAYK